MSILGFVSSQDAVPPNNPVVLAPAVTTAPSGGSRGVMVLKAMALGPNSASSGGVMLLKGMPLETNSGLFRCVLVLKALQPLELALVLLGVYWS